MSISNMLEELFFDRAVSYQTTMDAMQVKVLGIFTYENLPLTIPKRHLERYLTEQGQAVIYEHEGSLFASTATPGSPTDMYGDPSEVSITHRHQGKDIPLNLVIGQNAVLMRSDPASLGLTALLNEYCILMAQAKLSMLNTMISLRSPYILQAKDEAAYRSAMEYENSIRAGDVSVILAEEFENFEGIMVHQTPITGSPATQVIELTQYIQSMYYSELGVTLNNNMKREYVSDSEMEKSSGSPLVHQMLASREEAVREINALFGTEITVSLSHEWNDETEPTPTESDPNEEPESNSPIESSEGAAEPGEEPTEEPREEPTEAEEPEEPEEFPEVSAEEIIDATEEKLGESLEAKDNPDPVETDSGADTAEEHTEGDELEAEEENDQSR